MKDKLAENNNITANSKQIELLKKHFPQCFDKQGAFRMDKMQQLVGDEGLALSKESYNLNWLGKSYARLLANESPYTLIRENTKHNQKAEHQESQNLLIKGDNLEVLKHLTNAYREKVKMIYIDPPYNTGGDRFVYQDNRKFTPEQLIKLAGVDKEEAKRILDFTQSKANSHSAWLTFIYPRLYIARELLKDDGVIFISIDDNEQAQLKLLCDEIFGEENLLKCFSVKLAEATSVKMAHTDKGIPKLKEYVLAYKKNNIKIYPTMVDKLGWDSEYKTVCSGLTKQELQKLKTIAHDENRSDEDMSLANNMLKKIKFSKASDICLEETNKELTDEWCFQNAYRIVQFVSLAGGAKDLAVEKKKKLEKETSVFGIVTPQNKMYFIRSDFNHQSRLPRCRLLFADLYLQVNLGDFWPDIKTTGLDNEGGVDFKNGKKPLKLLKRCINLVVNSNGVILDFFSGSGTTAHATMALNAEDGGNRKHISVQLDEATDKKSEAYKAGYKSIFDITKARIEKAAAKIKKEYPDYQGDLGFKLFETVPVFKGYLDDMETLNEQVDLFDGSRLADNDLQDLLTTWKAWDGFEWWQTGEWVSLKKYKAYYLDDRIYFMHAGFTTADLTAFLQKVETDKRFNPSKLVLFGYNFDSKHQREINEALKHFRNKKSIEIDCEVRH